MIRGLVIITVAGFVMSVACISGAVAIGGPAVLAHSVWMHGPHGWRWESRDGVWSGDFTLHDSDQPQATRTLTWTGGRQLESDLPADVRFVQADGPATLTVRGPKSAVDHLVIDGSRLRFDAPVEDAGRVTVELAAPKVTRFDLSGSGDLDVRNYHQDKLLLNLSGSGDATIQGAARSVETAISGSSDADFSQLAVDGADVRVSGSGSAKVAPRVWAKLDVSGSGDISLLTRPQRVESHVSGSGDVEQEDGATVERTPGSGPARPV